MHLAISQDETKNSRKIAHYKPWEIVGDHEIWVFRSGAGQRTGPELQN